MYWSTPPIKWGILWAPIRGGATGGSQTPLPQSNPCWRDLGVIIPPKDLIMDSQEAAESFLHYSMLSEATVSSAGLGLNPQPRHIASPDNTTIEKSQKGLYKFSLLYSPLSCSPIK